MVGNSQVIFEKVDNSSLTLVGMFLNALVFLSVESRKILHVNKYVRICDQRLFFI